MKQKNKLLDALNHMDEHACRAVEDNNNGEAEQLEKDYNVLFDFISKQNKKANTLETL